MALGTSSGFEEFCGSPIWNSSQSWYTNHPHFTQCLERTIIVFCECGMFLIVFLFYLFYLSKLQRTAVEQKSCLFYLKMVGCVALVLVCMIDLLKGILLFVAGTRHYAAVFVSPLLQTFTFTIVTVIVNLEQKKAIVTSGVMFMFFLVLSIFGILSLYTHISHAIEGLMDRPDLYEMIIYVFYYILVVFELLLFSFADSSVLPHADDPQLCPAVKASFLSRITYWWIGSLVWKGYKQPLTEESLWQQPETEQADLIGSLLEQAWQRELCRCDRLNQTAHQLESEGSWQNATEDHETQISDSRSPLLNAVAELDDVQVRGNVKRKTPSLLRAVMYVVGPKLLQAHLCKFVADVLTFCGPLLQSLLVNYTMSESVETWKGYVYASLMFVTAIINSLLLQTMFKLSYDAGGRAKAGIISMVYKKALTMSNEARRSTTVGEIVNLMSVDAERLRDASAYLWLLWSCPLQITVALIFLYMVLGVSVFAGFAVMVILFPVNLVVANIESKLETKLMSLKDERMKIMNEVLSGIKVIKLYAWELSFQEKIAQIRQKELQTLKIFSYLEAVGSFSWTCAPFLVTLATFAVYVLTGGVLDANKAFTSLSLLNILRFPMSVLPMMISFCVTAGVSIKRLNKFFQTADIDKDVVKRDADGVALGEVRIQDGTFAWDADAGADNSPTLVNVNLHMKRGSLLAVVGSVGAGKSSLIAAILGEMEKRCGTVTVKGSVAYVAQQAWIQNLSLRDNILFGAPYDEERYRAVIEACALQPDLDILPAGDMTEIGENGINLSGGQKQRVAMARAVYQDCDIYLLDDPLSAVDSHVGYHLFTKVIGSDGLLAGKTRLLVTHAIHWLPSVDSIIVMSNGRISEMGTYQDLLSHDKAFAQFLKTYLTQNDDAEADEEVRNIQSTMLRQISSVVEDEISDMPEPDVISQSPRQSRPDSRTRLLSHRSVSVTSQVEKLPDVVPDQSRLIEDETTEVGAVRWSIYFAYCRSLGLLMLCLLLAAFLLFGISSVLSSLWLSKWTEDAVLQNASLTNTSIYLQYRDLYVGVYGGFGVLQALFLLIYAALLANRAVAASRVLHHRMLSAVLRAPLAFFETTPAGRILNRFSRDIETVDTLLPELMESWLVSAFDVLATVAILLYSTPIFLAIAVPLTVLYYFAQKVYVPTSRQLRRLESKTRSPIYVHFNETITGASTIRAFASQSRFISLNHSQVDCNLVYFYASIAANRWLGFRLEFLGAIVVLTAALFAVFGRGTLSASIVGLAITYALQVTDSLNWLVRMTSDLETNMVSVERIKEYTETDSEAMWHIEDCSPPTDWPAAGAVTFDKYSTRYRPGLDLVLQDIDLDVKAGKKVGIVGRTGAGKSSMTLALFRIIESAAGQIVVDGIHIADLGLHQLRSRITILPQDPALFSGSLRNNLDPFNQYADDELWTALDHAHLRPFVQTLPAGLEHECGEGGSNFSVGQRQLVCLARALLRKTSILVLDEATAAVDLETDELIQMTIRSEFADCTVLTIAHRLNTVLDSDRLVVLDAGRICEFDSPTTLLNDSNSRFYAMAKDAGIVT